MTSRRISESGEELCAVCSEVLSIYAIGRCDHVVCYRCSTRMRVLCEQMYCAICRADLPKVVFTRACGKFSSIHTQDYELSRKHKIYFQNTSVQNAFYDLLEHRCLVCTERKPFRTFQLLRDHVRKEHTLFYCDLCVNHLKVFTFERKFYDRKQLAQHRRIGDPDDTSYKGHPLCQFCDERFLDADELARHLRKEHYYCHFCDADGITNEFYSEYPLLRQHFAVDHFLCEEGECFNLEFTNAFRTEIDFKAHIAQAHSKTMRKAAARQARTLDLDFNYGPRPGNRGRGRKHDHDRRGVVTGEDYEEVNQERQTGRGGGRGGGRGAAARDRRQQQQKERAELETAQAISASLTEMHRKSNVNVVDEALVRPNVSTGPPSSQSEKAFQEAGEDFPLLHGESEQWQEDRGKEKRQDPASMAKKLARSANFSLATDGAMEEEDFPSLGGGKAKNVRSGAKSVWTRPVASDFPALGKHAGSKQAPVNPVQTSQQHAPARQHYGTAFSGPSDFPSLSSIGNALKNQPPGMPRSASSNQLRESNTTSKSDSKQQRRHSAYPGGKFNMSTNDDFPTLGLSSASTKVPDTSSSVRGSEDSKSVKRNEKQNRNDSRPNSSKTKNENRANTDKSSKNDSKEQVSSAKSNKSSQTNDKNKASKSNKSDMPSDKKSASTEEKDVKSENTKPAGGDKSKSGGLVPSDMPTKAPGGASDVSLEIPKKGKPEKSILFSDESDYPPLGKASGRMKNDYSALGVSAIKLEKKDVERTFAVEPAPYQLNRDEDYPVLGKPPGKKSSDGDHGSKVNKSASWNVQGKSSAPTVTKATSKPPQLQKHSDSDFPSLGQAKVPQKPQGWGPPSKAAPQPEKPKEQFVVMKTKGRKKHVAGALPRDGNENEDVDVSDLDMPNKFEVLQKANQDTSQKDKKKKDYEPRNKSNNIKDEILKATKENTKSEESAVGSKAAVSSSDPAIVSAVEAAEDFPSLGALRDQSNIQFDLSSLGKILTPASNAAAPPPGFAAPGLKPPPGVDPPPGVKPPPPGFTAAKSKAPPPPGFTSPEQPLSPGIVDENTAPEFKSPTRAIYSQPSNFAERNQKLLTAIQSTINHDPDIFQFFKACSGNFRRGNIDAVEYYNDCANSIGIEAFNKIFPELLALLPDIEKQQELLAAYKSAIRKSSSKKDKKGGTVWNEAESGFNMCVVCGQVLLQCDMDIHMDEHNLDAEYPSLGSAPENAFGMNSWVRAK